MKKDPENKGRPRSASYVLPIYDSMTQCAAHAGVPVPSQRLAKKNGCEAFHHGRVDLQKLLRWLFTHGEDAGIDWTAEYKRWQAKREKMRHDEEATKLVPLSFVMAAVAKTLASVDQILEQKLANEYPSAVAGLDVPQARVYGKRLGDQIRSEFQALSKHWA